MLTTGIQQATIEEEENNFLFEDMQISGYQKIIVCEDWFVSFGLLVSQSCEPCKSKEVCL